MSLAPSAATPRRSLSGLTDAERRARLRRMRVTATGLLLVAAAVYIAMVRLSASGNDAAWIPYVEVAAEAAMVGGLADWFAVTALFRHPLGIPIPHTALIPTRKDQLGRGLADFVSDNFLGDDVVRDKLRRVEIGRRLGEWLAVPDNARRVADELASAGRGALSILDDEYVHRLIQEALLPRLAAVQVSVPLGRLLERVVDEGGHREIIDTLAAQAVVWVERNRESLIDMVLRQAPSWSPRFVDEAVSTRIYAELLRVTVAVRDDPDHAVRRTIDKALHGLAHDLQHDPALQSRVQGSWASWVTGDAGREAVERLWVPLRHGLDEMVAEEDGPLRRRVTEGVRDAGARLVSDRQLQSRVDDWAESAAVHVVSTYRGELVATISETVDRWDGQETARRIELFAGRDLQFIRINGTVVGALAGLAIYSVTRLVS